jgi:hypothetical protein
MFWLSILVSSSEQLWQMISSLPNAITLDGRGIKAFSNETIHEIALNKHGSCSQLSKIVFGSKLGDNMVDDILLSSIFA